MTVTRTTADSLAARLPDALEPFARLACNLRWSWSPDGPAVFAAIDERRWETCGQNPVRLLQEAPYEQLERAAGDDALLERAHAVAREVDEDLARPAVDAGAATAERPAAFFCAEFGVHPSLPVYSGGLGALAGDILKEASDRALPMVAVGLLYRQGYFRQRLDLSGWQQEYWVPTDPERLPAALVRGDDGEPLTVTVPIHGEDVVAQVWQVDVGRVPLLLLDSDRPENSRLARWITARLYVGDPDTRLAQYALLGIGGVRALDAMGIEPGLAHLNEGHACFAALELARRAMAAGASLEEAQRAARERVVFTTHTPVPAGNDAYPVDQVRAALGAYAGREGIDLEPWLALGRTHPGDEHEPFGVTQFALRLSRTANAVSARHGEVARRMWQELGADIGHVTNGVHLPTWVGPAMRELYDRELGGEWRTDPSAFARAGELDAAALWAARRAQRATLVDYVRDRSVIDRLSRGEGGDYVEAAARAFDPDVLTLGFARRMATYKRLDLLVTDVDRVRGLLRGERPVQLLIAGKAHPRDDGGKALVRRLLDLRGEPGFGGRVVFLEDYDLAMAALLVQGCDVWLNVPRPPLEASGTSGMKNAVNGGLQLSVLDGWWPEAYDGANGWAIAGDEDPDHGAQDARDGAELYRLLEEEVLPAFYDHGGEGPPAAWLERVRACLRTVPPAFSAARMLRDYAERIYPL